MVVDVANDFGCVYVKCLFVHNDVDIVVYGYVGCP